MGSSSPSSDALPVVDGSGSLVASSSSIQNYLLPLIPAEVAPTNENAADWGGCGLAAFATATCVHFFEVIDDDITRLYSFDWRPGKITSLRFHDTLPIVAIGDDRCGCMFWDVERRRVVSVMQQHALGVEVADIRWKPGGDGVLAVLCHPSGSTLAYIEAARGTMVWRFDLSDRYRRLAMCLRWGPLMVLWGSGNVFEVLEYNEATDGKPRVVLEMVELTKKEPIIDVAMHDHFPATVLLMLSNDVVAFLLRSQAIVELIRQVRSHAPFRQFVQSRDTHRRLLVLHKNGAITGFRVRSFVDFVVDFQQLPRPSASTPSRILDNPMSDARVLLLFPTLGLAVYRVAERGVVSCAFVCPSCVSCVAADEQRLCYGTKGGEVVIVDFRSPERTTWRYKVGEKDVEAVALSVGTNQVFFLRADGGVGAVDFALRVVSQFSSRAGSALRLLGSGFGALVVVRDKMALGIFVDGKERPVLLSSPAVDVALDDCASRSQGRFAVLTKVGGLTVFGYGGGRVKMAHNFNLRAHVRATAVALGGDQLVVAFESGVLLIYDLQHGTSDSRSVSADALRALRIVGDSLYGLCGEASLFHFQTSLRQCPLAVREFALAGPSLVFVLRSDGVACVLSVQDWRMVGLGVQDMMPTPSSQQLARKLTGRCVGPMSVLGRPFWQLLDADVPFALRGAYGAGGAAKDFNAAHAQLYRLVQGDDSPEFRWQRVLHEIFAGNRVEACNMLLESSANAERDAAIAACLSICEGPMGEIALAQLKAVAMSLFQREHISCGMIMMLLAGCEAEAASFLIATGRIDEALVFIRALEPAAKGTVLAALGLYYLRREDLMRAALAFGSGGCYDLMLALMVRLRLVADAFFLRRLLYRRGLLRESTPDLVAVVETGSLEGLTAQLDAEMECLAHDVGIDLKEVRRIMAGEGVDFEDVPHGEER